MMINEKNEKIRKNMFLGEPTAHLWEHFSLRVDFFYYYFLGQKQLKTNQT